MKADLPGAKFWGVVRFVCVMQIEFFDLNRFVAFLIAFLWFELQCCDLN